MDWRCNYKRWNHGKTRKNKVTIWAQDGKGLSKQEETIK